MHGLLARKIVAETNDNGTSQATLALMARRVIDKNNQIKLNPDDLAASLTNLLGSTGAAAAIAALVSGADLTGSGVLTTLATNVGTNGTQGTILAQALQDARKIVTPITPVTTDTITINILSKDETIVLTPAGTLAALTLLFPSNANSRIGQIVRVVSHQIITTLTVSSSGLTLLGTAVTALAVDTPVSFEKIAASTWQRLA